MRILLVEDEARICAFLAGAFKAEGFTVDVVDDGVLGLARALVRPYDLVILDVLFPPHDGWDILRGLHRQRSGVPVLILSAVGDLATKLRAFELGAVDYLVKPFSLDELLARGYSCAASTEPTTARSCARAGSRWTSPVDRPTSVRPWPTSTTASFACSTS